MARYVAHSRGSGKAEEPRTDKGRAQRAVRIVCRITGFHFRRRPAQRDGNVREQDQSRIAVSLDGSVPLRGLSYAAVLVSQGLWSRRTEHHEFVGRSGYGVADGPDETSLGNNLRSIAGPQFPWRDGWIPRRRAYGVCFASDYEYAPVSNHGNGVSSVCECWAADLCPCGRASGDHSLRGRDGQHVPASMELFWCR